MPGSRERFARAPRWRRGYGRRDVDGFLEEIDARLVAAEAGVSSAPTAEEIRVTGFPLVRGGYDVRAVDLALDRREQRAVALEAGAETSRDPSAVAEVLRPVLERYPGERFTRTGMLRWSYDPDEVDDYCQALARHLHVAGPASLDAADVRAVTFSARRRGYDEDQVDAFLDALVGALLRTSTRRRAGRSSR